MIFYKAFKINNISYNFLKLFFFSIYPLFIYFFLIQWLSKILMPFHLSSYSYYIYFFFEFFCIQSTFHIPKFCISGLN